VPIHTVGSLLVVLLLFARVAAAQYHVDSWTTEQGLPQNVVGSIQQTRDGYIWMATLDGLVRFDGVRFTVFDRNSSPGIRSNRFLILYEAAGGALWAGTEDSGVTRYHQGAFTTYTTRDGLPNDQVTGVTGDAAGRVWVLSGNQIMEFDGARFHPAVLPGPAVAFYRSHWNPQEFWGSDRETVRRFTKGQFDVRPLPPGLRGVISTHFEGDPAGPLWMATADGRVARITDRDARVVGISDARSQDAELPATYRDRRGHEWPLRLSRSLIRFWTLPDAPATPVPVSSVFEDREGNIWLGANGQGLYRIRQRRVTVYSEAQGMSGHNIYPVYADRSGSVWMGAWPQGLSRITNGRVENYTIRDGVSSGFVTSLAEDRQGRLWIAGHHDLNGGLRVFENGRFKEIGRTLVPAGAVVHAMLHARDGALWLGTNVGLTRYQNGAVTTFTTRDGLAADDVKAIIEEENGRVWVGSVGGISLWQAGVFKSWTERDGLPGGAVRSLYRDRGGVLWIGTYDGGLGRFKDGRFSRFTTREGLYDNGVFQILEDARGYLWMGSNRGIYRVSKRELDAVADGAARRVTSLSLGRSDGLLSAECNGGTWPSGATGANGTLWFPTQDGVAVVDPDSITASAQPVPAVIESVLIDRTPVPRDAPIRLVPGQQALEIQYTGLSLVNSERIRFRYRLNGLDDDWVDAGTRRTAYYAHVPPGSYAFSVAAAGSDGAWTNAAASISVTVVPPFWRTWWFLTLTVVTGAGAGGAAYRYRVAGLERARAAQETFARQLIDSQERERRRIAAELHDSLGQHLIVIKNRALLGSIQSVDGQKQQFDDISASATLSLNEVKQIAYDLRPYHLDRLGLGTSIEAMTERIATSSAIAFTVNVPRLDGTVPKDQEINVYRIVQESLNNIVKHSAATHAAIDIVHDGKELMITIADNGKGFDARTARPATIGSGFGLAGMAERVGMLGGRHAIVSAPGEGTTVKVWLPGRAGQERAR
jgi:signal transduction histidine kinase/ligand-binding sensor domain-containing protein